MKVFISGILFLFIFLSGLSSSESEAKISLKEVWAYVMIGEETSLSNEYPITDLGYFVSAVSNFSDFLPVPPREKRFPNFHGRIHLVSSVDSRSQCHLLLDPKLPLRKKIINQLVKECKDYDGLQIDWEVVMKEDDEKFKSFLKILKKKLNGKMLTVAIPARVKTLERDAYDYAELAKIVDKIIVMAYDEHWSTSAPGPIASTAWCQKILDYAKTVIPEDKLVMGCHFYARAWNNEDVGRKAYRMYKIEDLIKENKVKDFKESPDGDLSFTFEKKTKVSVYYDKPESTARRCKMYADQGVKALSFWRLGQESPEFWNYLELSD
ncbi:MAG: glycoside hydrolase [Treponema sp.]|nr:glycoside hydrolase [Treponema sp.]